MQYQGVLSHDNVVQPLNMCDRLTGLSIWDGKRELLSICDKPLNKALIHLLLGVRLSFCLSWHRRIIQVYSSEIFTHLAVSCEFDIKPVLEDHISFHRAACPLHGVFITGLR